MELYTFQNNILTICNKIDDAGVETGLTRQDAEYYARKTCRVCWGKGWYQASLPHRMQWDQLCHCAKKRYNKSK